MIPRLAATGRAWLLGLPITVLSLISIAASGVYAWNLAGPEKFHLAYPHIAQSLLASVLLIVSAATTWRVIRHRPAPARFSGWRTIGILVGVLPASYYVWDTRVDPRLPLDFVVGLISILTICGQLLLSGKLWVRRRAPSPTTLQNGDDALI